MDFNYDKLLVDKKHIESCVLENINKNWLKKYGKRNFINGAFLADRIAKMLSVEREYHIKIKESEFKEKDKKLDGPMIYIYAETELPFGDFDSKYIFVPNLDELDKNGYFFKWHFKSWPCSRPWGVITPVESVADSISIILKEQWESYQRNAEAKPYSRKKDRVDFRQENFEKFLDKEFSDNVEYNSDLDYDQQSPDFWNQF